MEKTNSWKISSSQKKLLDDLFSEIKVKKIKKVLDIGSGRTSLDYLTNKFKSLDIKAVVYPGDERKITPIKECVKNPNYELIETDIRNLNFNEKFDIVLAHLFIAEAEKFGRNNINRVLNSLFSIKTNYLIIVNLFKDKVDYNLLLKMISKKGKILKISYILSNTKEETIGLLIKKNKN